MIDRFARRAADPLIAGPARALARAGMSADAATALALALGLLAAVLGALGAPGPLALGVFLAARWLDGVDGAIARLNGPTDRGAVLDIVLDFAAYGAVPLALAWRDPAAHGLPAAALLFAFYVNGASFLAVAAVAARRGDAAPRGPEGPAKGIRYTAGLAEGAETVLVLGLMLLAPAWFAPLAYGFAALCLASAVARLALAWRALAP